MSRTSTIPTDAYFVGLMHGIMFHGLGESHSANPSEYLVTQS